MPPWTVSFVPNLFLFVQIYTVSQKTVPLLFLL